MARSGPEVAAVFRRYGDTYREIHGASLCTAQRRVMSAIELCRTAALGGHVEHCDRCDHRRICYNSCRDRHCPKCQSLARAQWLEDRRSELLDTQYFHVVFTVPQPIAAIALQNKASVYNTLFRAASETLRTIAADPKHLGAQIGFFAVLHTWGQNLHHHPHLHCVVAGGGISPDGTRWISCRPDFFLPIRVLARLFRRLFLDYLEKAFNAGELQFFSSLEPLRTRHAFLRHIAPVRKTDWVVYAKPPSTDRNKSSDTSHATPTALPSPTTGCSTLMTGRFSFAGRTIATAVDARPWHSLPRSSSVASCFTFSQKASSAFVITASSPIATWHRSSPYAASSCQSRHRHPPTGRSRRITVTATRSSRAHLSRRAPRVAVGKWSSSKASSAQQFHQALIRHDRGRDFTTIFRPTLRDHAVGTTSPRAAAYRSAGAALPFLAG